MRGLRAATAAGSTAISPAEGELGDGIIVSMLEHQLTPARSRSKSSENDNLPRHLGQRLASAAESLAAAMPPQLADEEGARISTAGLLVKDPCIPSSVASQAFSRNVRRAKSRDSGGRASVSPPLANGRHPPQGCRRPPEEDAVQAVRRPSEETERRRGRSSRAATSGLPSGSTKVPSGRRGRRDSPQKQRVPPLALALPVLEPCGCARLVSCSPWQA